MRLEKLCYTIALLIGLTSWNQAFGLDLNVSDYFHDKDLGLFFTKPETGSDTVYYIPQIQENLRDLKKTAAINNVIYNVWEVTVGFQPSVDLDRIKQKKPEWANAGFLRSDVEVLDYCRANRSTDSSIVFVQKLEESYKRKGLISSSELFLCKVSLAVLPGDNAVVEYFKSRVATGSLVTPGIAPFKLKIEGISQEFDLAPSFQALHDNASLLRNISREAALVSIGASLKTYDSKIFEYILSYVVAGKSQDLLNRYFKGEANKYTLMPNMQQNILKLTNDREVEIKL